MSEGWRFTLRAQPELPVELGALLPERLAPLSLAEVERLPLPMGRRQVPLAEFFRVAGSPAARIVLAGDLSRFDGIGRGLGSGEILVEGDAGAELAAGQSAGEIRVRGSAGDCAALGMRAGLLTIEGNAGDYLGAAPPGERLGMHGGLIAIGGSIGARAGDRMRRGTILVQGEAGQACGARMVAGTIAVAGGLGALAGLRMRRGSLIARRLAEPPPATFAGTGRAELPIFGLIGRRLGAAAPWLQDLLAGPMHRWAGDLAVDGKGEILVASEG